jgi:hypothetical protein
LKDWDEACSEEGLHLPQNSLLLQTGKYIIGFDFPLFKPLRIGILEPKRHAKKKFEMDKIDRFLLIYSFCNPGPGQSEFYV